MKRNPAVSFVDRLSFGQRVVILLGLLLAGLVALLFVAPIPQDQDYHLFADTRMRLGIPNFNDVMSNTGLAMAGILGTLAVVGVSGKRIFAKQEVARPYLLYFVAVALVSLGSGYYHWDPSNERLFWDRLPMSIAFMAFAAAIIADRVHANSGNGWLLLLLIVLGILSLVYWDYTEQLQRGDLRFYAFVQFYPILVLPFVFGLFPKHRYVPGRYIAWVVFWYGLSKILEHFDGEVFVLSGGVVSGHTLKHLVAAVSVFVILRMLMTLKTKQPCDVSNIDD